MGVEEEYQLIDPATGSLVSCATAVRAGDWTGDLAPELQETTIEIGTPVCTSADAVREDLMRLRFRAGAVSAASGVALLAAGLHPFSRWEGHHRPLVPRYQDIEQRYGRIARDEHIFGMHVHVAVPPELDRLALMNVARHLLPHLLALSASSPFFEGEDTGFDSYRTVLWRRWPNSGVPPRFGAAAEYERYVELLHASGTIADRKNLYWSLRVHPAYPTLEFRVTDVCPRLDDAVAIAALARAIVVGAAEGILVDPGAHPLEQELLRVNEWRVARDGLEAELVDTLGGHDHFPVRDAIRRLLDRLAPVAERLGDSGWFADVERILASGNAAQRLRARYARTGDMRQVVEWLAAESLSGTGLDRKARKEPA
jgi:carboxylate-amine ligase